MVSEMAAVSAQKLPPETPSQARIPAKLTAMTTAPPTTAPSTIQRLRSASAAAAPRANPAMIIGNDPAASPTPRASPAGSGTTSTTGGPVAVGFAEVTGRSRQQLGDGG